jgi:hypothetical protein
MIRRILRRLGLDSESRYWNSVTAEDLEAMLDNGIDADTVAGTIISAQVAWQQDGSPEDLLYIYIVNWLGLHPDVPMDVFQRQLRAGWDVVRSE